MFSLALPSLTLRRSVAAQGHYWHGSQAEAREGGPTNQSSGRGRPLASRVHGERVEQREREGEREKRRARLSAFTSAEKAPKTSTRKGRFGNTSGGEPKQSFVIEIIGTAGSDVMFRATSESVPRSELYDHDYDPQVRKSYFQQESGRAARA